MPQRLHPAVVPPDLRRRGGAVADHPGHEQAGFQERRFIPSACDLNIGGSDWPLLAARNHGRARTLAWATDIGPHWLSQDFLGGRSTAN
ncbi:glutamine amidotransferase [Mesorhizobium sp. URHB0026]